MSTVDVIIPVYKPQKDFLNILELLKHQTVQPQRIILMNTEKAYFDKLLMENDFSEYKDICSIYHLSKAEFDHGKTRNQGVSYSDAEYFIMMTQDAVPKDECLIENLLRPLISKEAVVSYGRQLPNAACNPVEQYTRAFNYPEKSAVKGKEDIPTLGIKTFFCSDVCAAYERKIFDDLGGFINRTIFNEDMIYAAKACQRGYKIAYCADACVYHSHNYTANQQFHRNFDLGVSQADHKEIFDGLPSEGEGIRMVLKTMKHLWKKGYKRYLPYLIFQSGAKFIGYRLGKKYLSLPGWFVMKCTASPDYWKREIKN